jgi:hypothetical protein
MAPILKNRTARVTTSIGLLLFLLLAANIVLGHWSRRHILATFETPVQNLYVLCNAIDTYHERYDLFPPYLPALGPPPIGLQENRTFANLIDRDLAYGNKSGYTYRYHAIESHGAGTVDSFEIAADPISDSANRQHYFVDQTGIIRWESGRRASAASAEKPAGIDPEAPGGTQ